jgi:hypothetical protein
MTAPGLLPPGFAALEPFAARWAVSGRATRVRARMASEAAEREAFYQAARCCLDDALRYLDGRPLDELTGADARLLDLLLALTQVALAVELQRDAEPDHARVQARFVVERTGEDLGRGGPAPSATC